jgi:Integrase core domain
MYRLLSEHAEVRERRGQLRHPVYAAPELLARRPNELWSWDITKLLGPAKWTYFYLYVMLDVFSRYVVGWMVAHRESATLAQKFIGETCARQGINRGQDAEVPAGLPGAVRGDPGRPSPLPRLLPLVQHRAPSLRPRPADARRRALRPGRAARWRAGDRARDGLCGAPGTFPAGPPHPPVCPTEVWINPRQILAPPTSSAVPSTPLAQTAAFA